MSVEFIGFIANNNASETIVRQGPVLDPAYIETVAKAHELAGFDRALLAFHSTTPDALQIAQHVLTITRKLKVMIAQRPGFTAPTLLARQLATLDQLYEGRVSLHVITGGNAIELRQDGNTLDDKDERYARTSEFLDVVRLEWTSEKPFNYSGKYYNVENGFSQVKPLQKGGIYTFVGGGSDAAIEVSGKHADTFALWGESYAQVRDVTARVRAAAAKHGRPGPRFSLSVRPILADTEEKAWQKAEAILERATALQDQTGYPPATITRPMAPSGCWRWPSRARVSTSGCGRRSQNSPAPTATRPHWSAHPSRSPRSSPTITISASATS